MDSWFQQIILLDTYFTIVLEVSDKGYSIKIIIWDGGEGTLKIGYMVGCYCVFGYSETFEKFCAWVP